MPSRESVTALCDGVLAGVGRVLAVLGRRNANVAQRRSAKPPLVARVPRERSA